MSERPPAFPSAAPAESHRSERDAEELDVLVVGAGLSGIGAAVHLQMQLPRASFAILEARDRLGGTWDLFRYPGIRSDSDMFTLGYSFRPWRGEKSIADGPSILAYLEDTAREYGVDRRIRFGKEVRWAEWSSDRARWVVAVRDRWSGATETYACKFLFVCAGYYEYDHGYTPEFEGRDRFGGRVVHPQHWPTDLDVTDKTVVVVGSGATAVTLVPELAKSARQVVMVQRSPSYVFAAPDRDPMAAFLRQRLPERAAYGAMRFKNVSLGHAFYTFCRTFPKASKRLLMKSARTQLGDAADVETHFNPRYAPWDQRLCFAPGGDLFRVIRDGRAKVVTSAMAGYTERGVRLESGEEIAADVVVTATGLVLKFLGGMKLTVDGRTVDPPSTRVYRGALLSDVPNLAFAIGYTNASWTLKCDLVSAYVCRLLRHMGEQGFDICVPRKSDPTVCEEPIIDFSSSYVRRAIAGFPTQGSKKPWKLFQNYFRDRRAFLREPIEDGVLEFGHARRR